MDSSVYQPNPFGQSALNLEPNISRGHPEQSAVKLIISNGYTTWNFHFACHISQWKEERNIMAVPRSQSQAILLNVQEQGFWTKLSVYSIIFIAFKKHNPNVSRLNLLTMAFKEMEGWVETRHSCNPFISGKRRQCLQLCLCFSLVHHPRILRRGWVFQHCYINKRNTSMLLSSAAIV